MLFNLQLLDVDFIPNLDINVDGGNEDICSSSPEPKGEPVVLEIKEMNAAEKRPATKRFSQESEEDEAPVKKRPRSPKQPPPASTLAAAAPPKDNAGWVDTSYMVVFL